ncbi:glycosyl hydrolase family 28-related protein [Yersinia enterocolitica]|uniref:tail fiber/spike domain-containing protein n=1 Tax=Yersinia TaxID=629 RepID=UPI003AB58409
MTTTPTQNPVPSEAAVDLKFNAGKIDEFVTSFLLKYTDRLGRDHLTIEGMRDIIERAIKAFGFITMDSFEDGATLDNSSQVLRWKSNGEYYRWDGSFPKVVPVGSTPATTGGISTGAWVGVGDAALRTQLMSTSSGLGDALVGVKSTLTSSVGRTQHDKNEETLSVKDFGAIGDGVAIDTAAFVLACTSGRTVLVPPGTYLIAPGVNLSGHMLIDGNIVINSTCTIASDVTLRSGSITVNTGFTATFSGTFKAPVHRIFYGAGIVLGIKEVYPEWWGASSTVGSSDALMNAYKCATSTIVPAVINLMDVYLIEKTVTFGLSTYTPVTFKTGGFNITGSRFNCSSSFSGSVAVYFSCDAVNNILSFSISGAGLTVTNNATNSVNYGVQIGTSNVNINGLAKNRIENLVTEGFTNAGIYLVNARLLSFVGCATWKGSATVANGLGIRIVGTSATLFCGDIDFTSCQFVPEGTGSAVFIESTVNLGAVAGITFDKTAYYKTPSGTQLSIYCSNGGAVSDIWVAPGCQFDGFANKFVKIWATGTGSYIDNIHFVNTYFRGANAANSFEVLADNSAQVRGIIIDSPWAGNATSVFSFTGVKGFNISNAVFHDLSGGASISAINISACNAFSVTGAKATRSGASSFARLVNIAGACDNYVVTGNIGSGITTSASVSDTGTGATKYVANNI